MSEDGLPENEKNSISDFKAHMEYVASTQRELTPENLQVTAELVDTSMKVLGGMKIDEKTGFKTAYVMTRKITGTNFFNKRIDTSQPRFYVMIRDLDADSRQLRTVNDGYAWGLIIEYKKTGPNLEPMGEGTLSLPRSGDLVQDQYLGDLRSKNQDWKIIQELTTDLKQNLKLNKGGMNIEEKLYNKQALALKTSQ
jgi:hypothetical protein